MRKSEISGSRYSQAAALKVAGTSFLARGAGLTIVCHARKTRAKEGLQIKTNMAARGFFPARLLLSCFIRICVYPRLYLLVRP